VTHNEIFNYSDWEFMLFPPNHLSSWGMLLSHPWITVAQLIYKISLYILLPIRIPSAGTDG